MRMRKKKHADERIAACSDIMINFEGEEEILPDDPFLDNKTLHMEIGCGKGGFICELARQNPDINYIAVEKISNVIVTALERAKAEGLENIRFIMSDAAKVCEKLPEYSIGRLYLNFSDPWPKKGYAKRRLTHRGFLEKYKRILSDSGAIFFKTDNRGLFDFSLEEFTEENFRLEALTYDLHNSEYAQGNIMTEYEKNFSGMGIPINRVEAYLDNGDK